MIGILCAMQEESDLIIQKYNLKFKKKYLNISIYIGKNIILVNSGIGKIQATIGTMVLLQQGEFEKIINIGIAGNTGNVYAKIGDVFLPTTFFQHDVYLPFDGEHLNYIKGKIQIKKTDLNGYKKSFFDVFFDSVCATGDQFIDNNNVVLDIIKKYGADIVEMEVFAFLSVLNEFDLLDKAIVIKSVSDGADNDSRSEHETNLDFAMSNGIKVLDCFLY